MKKIRNIVFDLAGVVFSRDKYKTPKELLQYFSFINSGEAMPSFWQDYDRGTKIIDEVAQCLALYRGSDVTTARKNILEAVIYQRPIPQTQNLIALLKQAKYRLFVLSNMSADYIEYLRRQDVYRNFEGDVISCECSFLKPEKEIYELLLEKFSLVADQTLFIDDRMENVIGARKVGNSAFHFNRIDPSASCRELEMLLL